MEFAHVWGFPKIRVPFGGPCKKDYSILGFILGSPYFGKLPYLGCQDRSCLILDKAQQTGKFRHPGNPGSSRFPKSFGFRV